MGLDLAGKHITVVGATGSGKSYAVCHNLPKSSIFFDIQGEKALPKDVYSVNKSSSKQMVISMLRNGEVLRYSPQRQTMQDECVYLIDWLFKEQRLKGSVSIILDEIHLLMADAKTKRAIIELITTGRKYNIFLIAISQRLANIDNTIITQSQELYLFKSNFEDQYFKRYGLPVDELVFNKKYGFYIYDWQELKGELKI